MSKGSVCINCKQYTKHGHYVPPSLGDPGFFACEFQAFAVQPEFAEVQVMPGVLRMVPNPELEKSP